MKKDDIKKENLKEEIESWKNKYLRALADYQNLERRISENRLEERKQAATEFVLKFLPVLDDLLHAQRDLENPGLNLILKKADDILKSENIEKIGTKDKEFDPHLMECVELAESEADNRVVKEVRPGYRRGDKILRAARVVVGQKEKFKKVVPEEGK